LRWMGRIRQDRLSLLHNTGWSIAANFNAAMKNTLGLAQLRNRYAQKTHQSGSEREGSHIGSSRWPRNGDRGLSNAGRHLTNRVGGDVEAPNTTADLVGLFMLRPTAGIGFYFFFTSPDSVCTPRSKCNGIPVGLYS
jgi:hypothetical protein